MEEVKTLGELIARDYPDYEIRFGSAPMDMDITHGVAKEVYDERKRGYGKSVYLYPFVEWTDGGFRPSYFGGSKFHIVLFKK